MTEKSNLVKISRFITSKEFGTLGIIYVSETGLEEDLKYFGITLECYFNDGKNTPNYDCIPEGKYKVVWTYSPKFKRNTFRLLDVKGRSGILFHSANYAAYTPKYPNAKCDILGCIAIGEKQDFTPKSIPLPTRQITNSSKKVKEFEDLIDRKPFDLIIENLIHDLPIEEITDAKPS